MKTNRILALRPFHFAAFALLALASATCARALTLTSSDLIGFVLHPDGATPQHETARLQFFITLGNGESAVAPSDLGDYTGIVLGSNVPFTLPTPATFGVQISGSPLPITISSPYVYLLAKFGNDSVFYYLGGKTGTLNPTDLNIPTDVETTVLSHISLFNAIGGGTGVPDGGATIALLGGVLALFASLRRKFARV
jgi:hypothetical protein